VSTTPVAPNFSSASAGCHEAHTRPAGNDHDVTKRTRDRTELAFLVGGLALVLLLLGFASLSDLVVEGDTQDLDDRVLRALRRAELAAEGALSAPAADGRAALE
jgi:hypothetical protein